MTQPSNDITIDRKHFQSLHSAGRALYSIMLGSENPSLEVLMALQVLDEAIAAGHDALNTDRGFADEYINVAGRVTRAQVSNIKSFLQQEGISAEDIRQSDDYPA